MRPGFLDGSKVLGPAMFLCALATTVAGTATTSYADSLHMFCWGATSCASNSTPNLQTSTNPPQFGILDTGNGVTPGSTTTSSTKKGVTTTTTTTITDDLVLDILDPTKNTTSFSASALSPFSVTIYSNGTSTGNTFTSTNPTQSTAFTSGKLSAYLAGGGKDNFNSNPFSSITLLSHDTGFWVYQVDLGSQTIGNNQNLELESSPLDEGSVLVSFLTTTTTVKTCVGTKPCTTKTTNDYTQMANSEDLYENGPPPIIHHGGGETPLPATLPLFAGGLGALGALGWRRKRKAQAAI